jgi:acylphosphatase
MAGVVARRIVLAGRVQGVGFRDAAVQAAFALGIIGWVRNRRDGAVEAFAQGDESAVDRFVEWCRRGPPLARVTDISATDVAIDPGLRDFSWRSSV